MIGSDRSNSSSTRFLYKKATGTGSGSYTGSDNPFTVTMNAPITESVSWQTQYTLTFTMNGYGTLSPPSGSWENSTVVIPITISSDSSNSSSTRHLISKITGTGSGSYSSSTPGQTQFSVTMNAPINETITWTTRYMIPPQPGWNLISLPIIPNSTSIASLLRSQIASKEVVSVWAYSASSKSWRVFTPGRPSTLATMADGNGYWIYMRTADTLYVDGYVIPPVAAPPTYQLKVGWNLVGFKPQPTIQNEAVSRYLTSIVGSYDQNNVWIYDNTSGSWTRSTGTTMLTSGEAMWILVTSPSGATLRP